MQLLDYEVYMKIQVKFNFEQNLMTGSGLSAPEFVKFQGIAQYRSCGAIIEYILTDIHPTLELESIYETTRKVRFRAKSDNRKWIICPWKLSILSNFRCFDDYLNNFFPILFKL